MRINETRVCIDSEILTYPNAVVNVQFNWTDEREIHKEA